MPGVGEVIIPLLCFDNFGCCGVNLSFKFAGRACFDDAFAWAIIQDIEVAPVGYPGLRRAAQRIQYIDWRHARMIKKPRLFPCWVESNQPVCALVGKFRLSEKTLVNI